jgi:hypothetical protein
MTMATGGDDDDNGDGATGDEVNDDGDCTMSNDGDGATGGKVDDDGDDDKYGNGR